MIESHFAGLLRERNEGILITLRRDGRPQLSNVNYAFDGGGQLIRISTTDDRAKVRNLRRDLRAGFHVSSEDFWTYAVVEGVAELSPVAADPRGHARSSLTAGNGGLGPRSLSAAGYNVSARVAPWASSSR